jgi:hypothetical protein
MGEEEQKSTRHGREKGRVPNSNIHEQVVCKQASLRLVPGNLRARTEGDGGRRTP